jgi:hypothetical protein
MRSVSVNLCTDKLPGSRAAARVDAPPPRALYCLRRAFDLRRRLHEHSAPLRDARRRHDLLGERTADEAAAVGTATDVTLPLCLDLFIFSDACAGAMLAHG